MRLGVFGGSFDPVHLGHVGLVKQVREICRLDKVIVMPAAVSPFKTDITHKAVSGEDRLEMCRLAFEEFPFAEVSGYEISQKEVSYTVNTLRHIRKLHPHDESFFIMGGDMLLSFEKWRNYEEILSICTLLAVSRENDAEDVKTLEKTASKLGKYGTARVVQIETFPVSSTEIREKIKNNSDISCYVPKNVVKYISEHGLYTC